MGKFRKNKNILALDLTPLIDVVFLLLIFFILSTTFNKYSQMEIDIPTSIATDVEKKVPIEIVIDKNEQYFIIKDGITVPTSKEDIVSHLVDVKEASVTGDKNLKYQTVMDVITILKKNGIENLGINFYE